MCAGQIQANQGSRSTIANGARCNHGINSKVKASSKQTGFCVAALNFILQRRGRAWVKFLLNLFRRNSLFVRFVSRLVDLANTDDVELGSHCLPVILSRSPIPGGRTHSVLWRVSMSSLLKIVEDIATELVNVCNREPLETRSELSELKIYGERILMSVLHSMDNSFLRSLDPLSGHTQNSKAGEARRCFLNSARRQHTPLRAYDGQESELSPPLKRLL